MYVSVCVCVCVCVCHCPCAVGIRHQTRESTNVDKTVARASRSHHRDVPDSTRHPRGGGGVGPSRAGSHVDDDVDDDASGLVDFCDDDDRADVASYVYPSSKRSATGARRYGRQQSAPSGSTSHGGYDTVDTARVQRAASRSDAYEKVSSCRYVHIWQMPLPKAPDE